jgi:hypothetical protein
VCILYRFSPNFTALSLKLLFWQGFKGSISKFKHLVMVLRNLMESLLRRLQDVIDGQATILNTSQKPETHNWPFSGLKSLNKGRVYPKYTWGVILAGLNLQSRADPWKKPMPKNLALLSL